MKEGGRQRGKEISRNSEKDGGKMRGKKWRRKEVKGRIVEGKAKK